MKLLFFSIISTRYKLRAEQKKKIALYKKRQNVIMNYILIVLYLYMLMKFLVTIIYIFKEAVAYYILYYLTIEENKIFS